MFIFTLIRFYYIYSRIADQPPPPQAPYTANFLQFYIIFI